MPKVSVIIPTYNRAHMVGNAIQSVLDQTYSDWELIIVDDGSQDNTFEVVAHYPDPRIRYIYQDNMRTSGARNTGARVSTGEYIAFLDSDDLFLPDKLQCQLSAIERNPGLGLVASGWMEVNVQRKPLRVLSPWRLRSRLALTDWLYSCPVIVPAVLVERTWLLRVGLFDTALLYEEDWDLWLRLSYAGCPMAWEPGFVCLRTIHEESKIRNVASMHAGLFYMLDKFFSQPDLPDDVRDQREHVFANGHLDSAVRAFGAGMEIEGTQHLATAIRLNPALLEGEPPAVLQSLASTALTHAVRNVDQYVVDVCRSLPKVSRQLTRSPRQFRAIIRATAAFDHIANGYRLQARLKAAWALVTDPMWLRNRGLLSILFKP